MVTLILSSRSEAATRLELAENGPSGSRISNSRRLESGMLELLRPVLIAALTALVVGLGSGAKVRVRSVQHSTKESKVKRACETGPSAYEQDLDD